jgi:NAD(P)-dependent dehydrogenase (short-subunit alcohol dehydrogenase family)
MKAIYGYLGEARTCNPRVERDGLEIARQLLERGARVVITGRRKAVLDQAVHALAGSRRITGISADVTTPEGRQRSLDGTLTALGGLNILVNNAGGVRETPMMATSGMNPPGGRDTAAAVARDTLEAMIEGRLEVVRGGAERFEMAKRNRPGAVDEALRQMKRSMEEASRNHSALQRFTGLRTSV